MLAGVPEPDPWVPRVLPEPPDREPPEPEPEPEPEPPEPERPDPDPEPPEPGAEAVEAAAPARRERSRRLERDREAPDRAWPGRVRGSACQPPEAAPAGAVCSGTEACAEPRGT